jgi:hypothetical protein
MWNVFSSFRKGSTIVNTIKNLQVPTRGEEFLDPLCDYQLPKRGSDTWSSLQESANQCNTRP